MVSYIDNTQVVSSTYFIGDFMHYITPNRYDNLSSTYFTADFMQI